MLGQGGISHQRDFRIITWLAWLVLDTFCKEVDRSEKLKPRHRCSDSNCGEELLFDSAEYMRNDSRIFTDIQSNFFCRKHSEIRKCSAYLPPHLDCNAIPKARDALTKLRTSDMTSVLMTYMIQGCVLQLIGSAKAAFDPALPDGVKRAVERWKETVTHASDCLAAIAFIGCNEIDPTVIFCDYENLSVGRRPQTVLEHLWEHFVKDRNADVSTSRRMSANPHQTFDASPEDDQMPSSSLIVIDPSVLDLLWRHSKRDPQAVSETFNQMRSQVKEEFSGANSELEQYKAQSLFTQLFENSNENVWQFIEQRCKVATDHSFLVATAQQFLLDKLLHDNDAKATRILEYAIMGHAPVCASKMFIRSPIRNFMEPGDIVPIGSSAKYCCHWLMSNTCR